MTHSSLLTPELIGYLRGRFRLDWRGWHGAPHWARVRNIGIRLAESTGADRAVVEIFAFFHDLERFDDDHDPDHGLRSAALVRELNGTVFALDERQLDRLTRACDGHSRGLTKGDVTVMTCWDADRLDLGRVGIRPHPSRLCTDAARDPGVIEWAYRRSLAEYDPGFNLDVPAPPPESDDRA